MQIFRLDGKEYVAKKTSNETDDGKKSRIGSNMVVELQLFDRRRYRKMCEEIADKIENEVDLADLLEQKLTDGDFTTVEKFHRALMKGKKVKAEKHCYSLIVGKGRNATRIFLA